MKTEIHSDFYMVYCCKKNKWSLPTMPNMETRVTAMPSIQKLKALHCFRYKLFFLGEWRLFFGYDTTLRYNADSVTL